MVVQQGQKKKSLMIIQVMKIRFNLIVLLVAFLPKIGFTQNFQPYEFCTLIKKIKHKEKDGVYNFKFKSDSVVFEKSKVYTEGRFVENGDYSIYLYHFSNDSNYTFIKGGKKLELINEFKNKELFGWSYQILSDTLKIMTYYSDGLKNGVSIVQHIETKNILSITNYKNDTLNGSCLSYYSNGILKMKVNYEMGYPLGEYYEYYHSGNLKIYGEFKGGYLCYLDYKNGMRENWYYNGKLINKENLPEWLLIEIKKTTVPNYNSVYIDKKKWVEYEDVQ